MTYSVHDARIYCIDQYEIRARCCQNYTDRFHFQMNIFMVPNLHWVNLWAEVKKKKIHFHEKWEIEPMTGGWAGERASRYATRLPRVHLTARGAGERANQYAKMARKRTHHRQISRRALLTGNYQGSHLYTRPPVWQASVLATTLPGLPHVHMS